MEKKNFWAHPFDPLLAKTLIKIIPPSVKPNYITWLRFFLIPFILFFLEKGELKVAFFLFLFAAFTDALDGALARTRNQITDWGRTYDPLADKLLICLTAIMLITRYLEFWLVLTIIILEVIIAFNGWRRKKRGEKIQANIWGKIKMSIQVLGVALLFAAAWQNNPFLFSAAEITFLAAIFFAIISLFTYSL